MADSSVPVIVDFRGTEANQPEDVIKHGLWCLLPGRVDRSAVVVGMSRDQFVEIAPTRFVLIPAAKS